MSYILKFNYRHAFVGPDDKGFDGTIPNENLVIDEEFSLFLAYIYLACREGRDSLIIVDNAKFRGLLKFLFPAHTFEASRELGDYEEGIRNVKIDILDTEGSGSLTYRGVLMKPIYMPRESTQVYSLYEVNGDPESTITKQFCRESLQYFNNVIRNRFSGKGPVIWTDPVSNNTKLLDDYDKMFALYIVDKFLTVVDPSYPTSDADYNLAMTLTLLDKLRTEVVHVPTESKPRATHKPFNLSVVLATDKVSPPGPVTEVLTPVSEERRNLSDVLHYFLRIGFKRDTEGTVILTGFRSYGFLINLCSSFPALTFEVYAAKPPTTKKSLPTNLSFQEIILKPGLAAKYANQSNVYYISNLPTNDMVIKSMNPVSALVPYNPRSNLHPQVVFASCFTKPNSEYKGRALVTSLAKTQNTVLIPNEFFTYIDAEWRNTNAWEYSNPITGFKKDSFDNVFLATCVNLYLTTSGLTTKPQAQLKKLLESI